MKSPRFLALGPGAMGFFALLGYLRKVDLSRVEEVSGASAGALLGLFICMGLTPDEIFGITVSLKSDGLLKTNLMSLVSKYGLISLEPLKVKLKSLIGDPTFESLQKKLHVAAFCVDTGQTEYFSGPPDAKVLDYIIMSIAVPFLFETVRYEDKVYVDGGLIEHVPLTPFLNRVPIKEDSEAPTSPESSDETLAIQLVYEGEESVRDFLTFAVRLVTVAKKCQEYPDVVTIHVNVNLFNFSMPPEVRKKLFSLSEDTCRVTE